MSAEDAVAAVLRVHQPRIHDGDGYSWTVCVEDRQQWPCATVKAIDAVRGNP